MIESVRVLVVDDDEPLAKLIAKQFEKEYPEIDGKVATTVEDGLEIFRKGSVDAIVSDYDFKGEEDDGLDFLEKIRSVDSDFPFVLFTGKGGEEIAERATANNVTAYIRKQTGVSQYGVVASTVRQSIRGYRASIENERRLSALEAANEGICILDSQGKFEYANGSYLSSYKQDRSNLIGKDWASVHPDEEVKRFQEEVLQEIQEKGEWKGEITAIDSDGNEFTEMKAISSLDGGGLVIVSTQSEN